jgi:hypothetical protein
MATYIIRASVRSTAEGGRIKPIWSGYRPQVRVIRNDAERLLGDAVLTWQNADHVQPGAEGLAVLIPMQQSNWGSVGLGSALELLEGQLVSASAIVTEILP